MELIMESFSFKGYTYSITNISGKSEFDAIYKKLLDKANKGRSIVKELEKAYRISPTEVYLIRFDQARHALVPVRVLKEAVDGFLMKNRYDNKDKTLQMGIGNEISRHSTDVYETVEKKHKIDEENRRKFEEKRAKEREALIVTGVNILDRLNFHSKSCDEIKAFLELHDYSFRENRDYKMKVEAGFEAIKDLHVEVDKKLNDVKRAPDTHIHRVTHLVPRDIDKDDPPEGFMALLQQFLFLSVFNGEVEKAWVTMRDYTINKEDLPVKINQIFDKIFSIIANTNDLVHSLDRILFPGKSGSVRETAMQYSLELFTKEVIDIFTGKK